MATATSRSWVESANVPGCDFPLDNLPFCAFVMGEDETRLGVGIGDCVLDLRRAVRETALAGLPFPVRQACSAPVLNDLMRCGAEGSAALRSGLLALFSAEAGAEEIAQARPLLTPVVTTQSRLPVAIGNYTDFYASIEHATRVGRLFRPDEPLLPNYKWVPIGYHGRASSVQVSGTPVTRPCGQRKSPADPNPVYGPSRQLDYELEMGAYVGVGNALGETVPIAQAAGHLFGMSLLNDWSARDIQAWEYQPLGPFLSKSFLTSVSPWVVTMAALEPYRVRAAERQAGDPQPLPYLAHGAGAAAAYDVQVEVSLLTGTMRGKGLPPAKLTTGNVKDLYWTFAQLLTHHASNGCNLMPGDLLGSGTLSGKEDGSSGCLLELTRRGTAPLPLAGGESRTFLEDGDEVIFHAFCERAGLPRIGFGECRGLVKPASVQGLP